MPKRNQKLRRVSRMILPPVLTVGASIFILIEANWLHHRQATPIHTTGSSAQTYTDKDGVTSPSLNGMKQHAAQKSGSAKAGQTSVAAEKTSKSSSTLPANHHQSQPAGNLGFSPVSGGTVKPASDPTYLELKTPFSSTVTQYGPAPQTTFNADLLSAEFNIHVTFNLPTGVASSQVVLLPLSEGVLWGVIPTQSSDNSPANGPSMVYYTPYSGSNPSNITLSETAADSIGQIPVTTSISNINTSWYKPQVAPNSLGDGSANITSGGAALLSPNQSGNDTENSAESSGSNDANAAGTNITDTSKSVSNQPVIRTISDVAGRTNLYLKSLYQVDGGAVIVLRTERGSALGEWAFLWNEATKSIKPICSVENTATDFGWIAIGQHTAYWSERSLIGPANVYYTGTTHMMTLATGEIRSIQTGTWSGQGIAGQNINTDKSDPDQADDELYFRVNNTQVWNEFLPGK